MSQRFLHVQLPANIFLSTASPGSTISTYLHLFWKWNWQESNGHWQWVTVGQNKFSFLNQVTWAIKKALELECHQRKICYSREQPAYRIFAKTHKAFLTCTVFGYFALSNITVSRYRFSCTFSLKNAGKEGTRWSITLNNPFILWV